MNILSKSIKNLDMAIFCKRQRRCLGKTYRRSFGKSWYKSCGLYKSFGKDKGRWNIQTSTSISRSPNWRCFTYNAYKRLRNSKLAKKAKQLNLFICTVLLHCMSILSHVLNKNTMWNLTQFLYKPAKKEQYKHASINWPFLPHLTIVNSLMRKLFVWLAWRFLCDYYEFNDLYNHAYPFRDDYVFKFE